MIETHNVNFSFQLLCQPDRVFWFLYVKLGKQATSRTRYTTCDAETLAQQYLDQPITPELNFESLWENRIRFTLTDLEQGVQKQWYEGRTVLVGDAAHKMTPNLAYGFNAAFESAAALTNHLTTALAHSNTPGGLDICAIKTAFANYQMQRFARAKRAHDFTNFYTRFAAWENSVFRWGSILAPKLLADDTIVDQFAKLVKGGVKLAFINVPDKPHGTIGFDDEI
jgi:2-polyprenyl-6-methoxyphenol hydroxylase-like FAD-dependent oxidoreductase